MESEGAARPICVAEALFVDDDGELFVIEPTDQAKWDVPAGRVDGGETPREACARAVRAQLGLDLSPGRLLVVDWAPHVYEEQVYFVFDGGVLSDERLDAIEVADDITSWACLPAEDLFVMLEPGQVRRLTAALAAREAVAAGYLEHGVPVEADQPTR